MENDQRTLEELDGQNWGEPETAPTEMVARCLRLRRTPLQALGHGDLRLLIGQQIGLRYLVPRALELLSNNPLMAAEYYPGDLLCALLRADKSYWSLNAAELKYLLLVAQSVASQCGKIVRDCEAFLATNGDSRETLN
jgi:hypothetical protein